jgi:hypothetical protein
MPSARKAALIRGLFYFLLAFGCKHLFMEVTVDVIIYLIFLMAGIEILVATCPLLDNKD